MLYRITSSRFDVPTTTWREFKAESDDEAQGEFEKAKLEPSIEWDDLQLLRVDQVEKTTPIGFAKRQDE